MFGLPAVSGRAALRSDGVAARAASRVSGMRRSCLLCPSGAGSLSPAWMSGGCASAVGAASAAAASAAAMIVLQRDIR
jgi:hypothetical protein